MIKNLLFILMGHLLGDYLFQTSFISTNKSNCCILFIHCVLYICGIAIMAHVLDMKLSTLDFIILLSSHFIIDLIKTKGITPKYLGSYNKVLILDQIIHLLVFLLLVIF